MNKLINDKTLREFGFIFGFSLPVVFGFLIPIIFSHSFREWTLFVGLIFIFLSIIKPRLLFYPYKAWMKLGNVLGWINSRIILGSIFIFILCPISLIMKIFKYKPLKKKEDNLNSYKEDKKGTLVNLKKIF